MYLRAGINKTKMKRRKMKKNSDRTLRKLCSVLFCFIPGSLVLFVIEALLKVLLLLLDIIIPWIIHSIQWTSPIVDSIEA
jgi:hypothetical protein